MGMIYGFVLAIPLLSVLVRSAYVVVNKNAKDSYSGNITQVEYVNANGNLPLYDVYFSFNKQQTYYNSPRPQIYFSNYEIIETNIPNSYLLTLDNATYVKVWNPDGNENYMTWDGAGTNFNSTQYFITLKFDVDNIVYSNETLNQSLLYRIVDLNGLDNAFDYSLNKYVDDNSFGKLNFFEWFFDIFFDSNQQNNLYIRYVNWYMNYVLLVSCSYILFLVLMWFVNYSRRILERGLDYDW